MARLTLWMAAGYAVHHIILLVDRAMATTLGAGKAASLQFAYHVALVVGQVSGLAVSTALFPHLAERSADGNTRGVRAALGDALRIVLLIGLPATSLLLLLRAPLIDLLLTRGAFDAQAAAAASQPLLWYAWAVLADALCQPLWRFVYAWQNHWTVLAVNGLQTAIRLLCNLVLIPAIGYNGIAVSALIGLFLQAGVLSWWAWRQVGPYTTRAWWNDAARIVSSTAAAAASAWIVIRHLRSAPPLAILAAAGLAGGGIYLAALKTVGLQVKWRTPIMHANGERHHSYTIQRE
jgi:putative peptidoglycan lipid II flippase